MSSDRPRPVRTRRILRRRSRTPRGPHAAKAETEAAPLVDLRRRCAGGAIAAGSAYLAVLTISTVRPAALREVVAFGLLIGFGAVAGLCALAAVLAWAVDRMPRSSAEEQAETVKWAIRLGEDMAGAFPLPPAVQQGGEWEKSGRRSATGIVHQRHPESPKLR